VNQALDWPLLAARFSLLVLGFGLFGKAAFELYAPASVRRDWPAAARVAVPLLAALAAIGWIAALARQATGASGAPALADLLRLCLETGFGRALAVAGLLALALAVLGLAPRRPPRLAALLSGGLLASLAFVGHPAAGAVGAPGAVRIAVFAAHLLGAGVWLGGLLPLALALPRAGEDTGPLLREFGRIAVAAVALQVTTGMVVAVVVFTLAHGPPGMTYVKTLLTKLGLVAAMLAVASVNRWRLTPLAERAPAAARRAFAWTIAAEQVLALGVIAAVTLLGQTDPSM
jgi:putative copper resistance protein D